VTADQLNLVLAVAAVAALLVLAAAAVVAVASVRRIASDVSDLTSSLDKVAAALNDELPPTLRDLRTTSANLARLSEEVPPRIERIDGLMDEADATLKSLRATVEEAENIVRGPAAAVDRAKRAAGSAGRTLAAGADRLRRGVEERMG
jgi:ABC-type transporter Mla subunit MlaD